MVDPDGGREPNPRTLSTRDENPEFLPIAQFKKDVSPPATKAEATAYASQARKLWEEYVAEQAAKGIFIDVSGDKVVRLTKQTPSLERPEGMSDERWDALQALRAMEGETEPKWVEEPDIEGKLLYDFWQSSLADAKEFQGSVGTARSFLDSEEDKTAEIRRQYKDFEDRASLVYDLMSDEQRFAMNADDQNAQNAASREKGYLLPAEGGYYSPFPAGGSLSQIIRPSLPDYVRPDYRLNAAVGLPGPQGFDDPDYDEFGMPRFAYGTGAQSDTWFPGAVPTAGLPGQLPRMDYPSWVSSVAEQVMFNLRDGNPANDGRPAGWDESRYGDWENLAAIASQYSVMPQSIRTRIYDWAQNTQDPSDLGWATSQIGSRPAPSPADYTQTLTLSEQLALRKQAQDELETLLNYSGTPRNYVSGSSGGSRSSGGGGGSSGTDYGARLGYESASADIDAQLAREKFELQKELMLLQFALDNDPNNPQLQLERDRLAEQVRQFDIAQAQKRDADEKAIQLQRARIIADYSANPGDAVAREYFLRQGINPMGTAVNVFTGQPTGEQMTLSEAMEANAPLVSGGLQGAVTGTPPPITTPDDEEEPAFAYGTNPKLTRDGWTRARKFIAGDPQVPGMVNPEKIQLRVRDGQPEAKVTPLSQMMRGGVRRMGRPMPQMSDRMPMFASGTDAWRISRAVTNASTGSSGSTGGSTSWDWLYQAPQEPVYTPPTDYLYSGQVQTQTKGTPAIAPSSAGVDANNDGLDDLTGWANGVISDPSSPSGFSYNGIPTSSTGAPYTAPAPAIAPGGSPVPTTPTATKGTPAIAPSSPGPDANNDGLDDRTGWAVGVVRDPASPSGFSYNGQPVESSGAPYNPPAPPPASTTPPTPGDIPWYRQLYPGDQKVGNTIGNPYLSHILDGGSPTDIVPNRDSPYYGMTMEQAALLMHWANVNPGPQLTVVGPVADTPGMYDKYGNPLPYAQVNTQAEMGYLSPAQLARGETQSINPRYPGYRPPEGIPVSQEVARILGTIPGYTPPQSTLPVVSGGIVKSPDGGATYTLMPGDVQQPDGTFLRYNPVTLQYEPVIPEYTPITSMEEFWALPEDVQQKIFKREPTGYYLSDAVTQGIAAMGVAGVPRNRMLTQEEFNALSPDKQRALVEGDVSKYPELSPFVQASGSYIGPSITDQTEYGFPFWRPTGLLTLPAPVEVYAPPYNYSDYITPEWISQNYPPVPVTPTPITPTYPPGWEPGTAPAQGNTPTPDDTPPPAVPSAPPPPATGTTPPPASTATPTLSDLLGQLLGLSYGGDVYQNLPALQYAMGNLTPGEYDTISNAPIQVPGLGLTLPSASQMMNYEMLQNLIENGSFDLLNSLYTAGNVPLSLILAMARARAPLGSASEPTLIETT